jgi:multidrug resistance efflux pump
MKRGFVVLLLIVAVGSLLAAGWWWVNTSPGQVVEFLAGGGLDRGRAEEFVALVGGLEAEEEPDALVASGSIEGETVSIVSELGGQILALHAGEGDEVRQGQLLVELDASLVEAQSAQVEAAVAAAEANLANVQAGTHPAEILVAQAALHEALARRDAAQVRWNSMKKVLENPREIEAQIVEARNAVAMAESRLELAGAKLAAAILERDKYKARGSLEEKRLYESYNYQVEAAQAALDGVREARRAAQANVAALEAVRRNPLALEAEVHAAESEYEIAAAGVGVAVAKLDELKAGATDEAVAVAEAMVDQARASMAVVDAQLDKMVLHSPIEGVVTSQSAHAGEAALPGSILMTVANLDEVTLTIYVPEDELGRVYLGQEVDVQVDSFPGELFRGTVAHIAQQAEFTPKNIQTEKERVNMVFAVKVRLLNSDHRLKPGMPADAFVP